MRFLYLCFLSFVFITSCAFSLSREVNLQAAREAKTHKFFTPLPTLRENATFPIISAQAALAIDLDSGVTLYEKDPDKLLLPASTTKIITALVAMDYYPLDMVLKVGKFKVEGQKMGLVESEKITADDLLYGLLIFSANDAAEVLAQNFPGGRDLFIAAMNLKAHQLHLENSNFINPSGLEGGTHVSTARDLIRVSEIAMQDPKFAEIVGTKEKEVKSVDGKISHKLVNINELIGSLDGVLGVKTGWTENARENLVTYIERNERKIMIAVLASQDRFGETRELIGWIFDNYEWKDVIYSP